jgi:cytochrome o ubiquinol oxidase subunit II
MPNKIFRLLAVLPLCGLLSGCDMVLMFPAGDVAVRQRDLILVSTGLMLLIVIPVIALTLFFAWRYRESNTDAVYDPEWHHSTQLEVVIWAAPLVIIVAMGALTWIGTHLLDPWRPLERIEPGRLVASTTKGLNVEVVALDWKWLFFYPDLGIATLNEVAAPVDVPINFKITSSSVMNSFFIPALAGQIYAMPGMQTQLHAVINQPGEYRGLSANYSGAGFSDMHFLFHGMTNADFAKWVQTVKSDGGSLTRQDYMTLEKPSEREPVRHFSTVDPGLFSAILNMCVDRAKMCRSDMSRIDDQGGLGLASVNNVAPLAYDKDRWGTVSSGSERRYVAAICTTSDSFGTGSRTAGQQVRQTQLAD